ncbi:MAG: biotin transporter BioY [Candidatus Amoebophilus sp.]
MKFFLITTKRINLTTFIANFATSKYMQTFLGSWLIALGAQISIPFHPVPMTLQTFTIALISLLVPFQVAVGSVVFYITYAAMGMPVLEGSASGIGKLLGPTAGYIVGFLLMSAITNLLIKSYPTNSSLKRCLFILAGGSVLFISGMVHLSYIFGWNIAIKTGLLPFILSEVVKYTLAAQLSLFIQNKNNL